MTVTLGSSIVGLPREMHGSPISSSLGIDKVVLILQRIIEEVYSLTDARDHISAKATNQYHVHSRLHNASVGRFGFMLVFVACQTSMQWTSPP